MFVVAGVTGNTGSVVAATLLEKKQPVRVVVRSQDKGASWKAKGAEVAVVSLDDSRALAKVFEGAKGAYLLVPPNYQAASYIDDRKKVADGLAEAVKASSLPHVVFLSSIGAQLPGGTGPIRVVRYGEQKLGAAKANGVLPTFIAPAQKIAMIATHDIGRIAAEQLIAGGQGRKVLELSGPEDYSPDQVAAVLAQLLNRTVTTQQAPLSTVVPTFKSFGFSEDAARLFEEMYRGFVNGQIDFEKTGATHVRGYVTLSEGLAPFAQAS